MRPKELTENEFNDKVAYIAKALNGATLGQAFAVLDHVRTLLLSTHTVDASNLPKESEE